MAAMLQATATEPALKSTKIDRKKVPDIFKGTTSSPVVSSWPENTCTVFNVLWANFLFVKLAHSEDEVDAEFKRVSERLKTLFPVEDAKDQRNPYVFSNSLVAKFGDDSKAQGRLNVIALESREEVSSKASLVALGGSGLIPTGAHMAQHRPASDAAQRNAGIDTPLQLDFGMPTFAMSLTESFILFHKLTEQPFNIRRLWLKHFQKYFALNPHWGLAQTVITGLKRFKDVRKYSARFEAFLNFVRFNFYKNNIFCDTKTLLQNLDPAAVSGWINFLIIDKTVSTIRGYVAAVNYFLKRLRLRPLHEIDTSLSCTVEGWRKLLAEEEGEKATQALSWPQIVETFSLAEEFFRDPKKYSPTCYHALVISFWNALRTTEARELTFIQCALFSDDEGNENLISTLWEPKTGKKNRRHQHIILSEVLEQNYKFCPILNFKQAMQFKVKGQICLFADAEGLPFREHEFYNIWKEFFQLVRGELGLGKGRYSFYTFRSSSIINYHVNFHMDEMEIKAISRHTKNSTVLKNSYLVKDLLSPKWKAAKGWAERFQTKDAYTLNCTVFDKFFDPEEWFECGPS